MLICPGTSLALVAYTPTPTANSNSVPLTSNIELDFDSDINLLTVNNSSTNPNEVYDDNVKIVGSQSGQFQGVFSFGGDNSIVIFNPSINFKAGEKITVTVSNLVMSTGAQPANPASFSFIAATGPFEGAFREVPTAGIIGITYGDMDWGDYDNDGDLDVAVIGWDPGYSEIAIIYNNVGGVFTDIDAGLTGGFYSTCKGWRCDGQLNRKLRYFCCEI